MENIGSDIYVGAMAPIACDTPYTNYVAKLNRATGMWEAVGDSFNGPVYALASIGNRLLIGGSFTCASGNTNANRVAELVGNTWTTSDAALVTPIATGNHPPSYPPPGL